MAAFAQDHVGGNVCGECHAQAYTAWRGSHHDLAMQVADERTVLGNFAQAKFTYAGTTSSFFRRDGRFVVRTDGPDGKLADYPVKYTFGVYPLQQYLIELPGGRLQALSIAWDTRPKAAGGQRWFHMYPGQGIKAGDPLHWTGIGQNWNFMCSECHSTNLRKNFDAKSGEFHTTWAEVNVSCEACHGPGARHVTWARSGADGRTADKGLALALDERKGATWAADATTGQPRRSVPRTSAREVETCARCHARGSRISDDYVHGKPLLDTHRTALLEDSLYWVDGQMRDEVYNWGSFLQSRMNAAGVTCSDCHDPHTLKLRTSGNALCAQCHAPARYDAPAHTHHASGTAASSCVACHMPATTYMVVDPRHDHSFRIPRPDQSAALGTPNACNGCHSKQTAAWASSAIAKWTGRAPSGFQTFAESMQKGATGAPGGRGALMTIAEDKAQPAVVRATALTRLARLATPVTRPTFAKALDDPDPVVRLAAVDALAGSAPDVQLRYLPRMTADPVRAVRTSAARALVGPAQSRVPQENRATLNSALEEYRATLLYNADRPESRLALAGLYSAQGDRTQAIAEIDKAIALDATFVPAYVNLSDLHRQAGDEQAAEAALRRGLVRVPKEAALHHALGLSLIRQRDRAQATKEFAIAAQLDPGNARYAYVYAVALHDTGQATKAREVLAAALTRLPFDRELLLVSTQYASEAGDREAAKRYVTRLREVEPDDPRYARLAAQIEEGRAR